MSSERKGNLKLTTKGGSQLLTIATQCPSTGGDAVYLARNLYNLIFPDFIFNDEDYCNSNGLSTPSLPSELDHNKILSEEEVLIYPNPTSGVLELQLPNEHPYVLLEVKDLLGKTIIEKQIFDQKMRLTLDLKNLPDGLHIIVLRTKDNYQFAKKILKTQ